MDFFGLIFAFRRSICRHPSPEEPHPHDADGRMCDPVNRRPDCYTVRESPHHGRNDPPNRDSTTRRKP